MTPEDAPPPGTACIVINCEQHARLYIQVVDTATSDEQTSIAMCDGHASNRRGRVIG